MDDGELRQSYLNKIRAVITLHEEAGKAPHPEARRNWLAEELREIYEEAAQAHSVGALSDESFNKIRDSATGKDRAL